MPVEETKRALIVVRTYPTPAKTGAEVSCTAAITDKGEWLRLFPVPWRYLDKEQQFRVCCLIRQRDRDGHPTLGIFRPKTIERLVIEADSPTWSHRQLGILRQGHLFAQEPKEELEKIPYKFKYKFRCECRQCTGHKIICVDWEMAESYRKWRTDYGDGWETKFRLRYEKEMIEKYDTHFYMGTVHLHPQTWIIVGLFYPPRSGAGLFDGNPQPVL